MTLWRRGSSLTSTARQSHQMRPPSRPGYCPPANRQIGALTYGADGGVLPGAFGVGFLRSLVRVPPALSRRASSARWCVFCRQFIIAADPVVQINRPYGWTSAPFGPRLLLGFH